MDLELISFNICPFVQRSVIALNEKNVSFKITYIDLAAPPDWFLEISPLAKVPLLKVDGTVLFESAVIAEYLDEVYPPMLHPVEPLEKARHRAWIEFASEMIMSQYRMLIEKEQQGFDALVEKIKEDFKTLELALDPAGAFFSGNMFHLVDSCFAPVFTRYRLIEAFLPVEFVNSERLKRWSESLCGRDSVVNSVSADFEQQFINYFKKNGGIVKQYLPEETA